MISTPKQMTLYPLLKLFIEDVCLPKTSWKAFPQTWASRGEASVPKVVVNDTVRFAGYTVLFYQHFAISLQVNLAICPHATDFVKKICDYLWYEVKNCSRFWHARCPVVAQPSAWVADLQLTRCNLKCNYIFNFFSFREYVLYVFFQISKNMTFYVFWNV